MVPLSFFFHNFGKFYHAYLITFIFSPTINFIPQISSKIYPQALSFPVSCISRAAAITKMEHDEMGFQTAPEGPILCVNNCGFFGSPANMNMCSKCYKDLMSKQEQAQLAASSLENIVEGSSSGNDSESSLVDSVNVQSYLVEGKAKSFPSVNTPVSFTSKEGPSRCSTCKKRVGLTGFSCRCGNLFCGTHRYSDKHECPIDYRRTGQDAIAKANPVVKAEKLDKI